MGGDDGAEAGKPIYSCATSEPDALPEFVIVAVILPILSKRSDGPPGTVAPVVGPDETETSTARPE